MPAYKHMMCQYETQCNNCDNTIYVGESFTFVFTGKWKLCRTCVPH